MNRRLVLKRMGSWSAVSAVSAGGAATLLSGCAGPQPADYAQEKPVLDLRQYFNGTVDAWGVFTDRSGKVVKRFTVVMQCSKVRERGYQVASSRC